MNETQASETQVVQLRRKGLVAQITLSRPEALNAINQAMLVALNETVAQLAEQVQSGSADAPRAVIVTGAGKAFVAGADIAAMADLGPREAAAFSGQGQALFAAIESLPVPVIAAVNGFALGGGCELALACDVILASEKAKFGQPEVKLGLIPGFGGCVRLPGRIGAAAAARWIYTGEMVGAAEAQRLGLVSEVVAPEGLLERAHAMATEIAQQAPLAVQAAKRVLRASVQGDVQNATELERLAFGQLFTTADMREGTQAFLAKRAPEFAGK